LATGSELTMSALIAQKSVVQSRGSDIETLLSDYKKSIDFVNESPDAAALISEKGFIADVEIAEKAIPGCNLVFFEDRSEGASLLKTFYEKLFETEPTSIGGNLPDEDFYY
jgi:NitT/TauT family transport system substrate-binding protein